MLVGAGHAHVEVLRRLARRSVPGLTLTVVARERYAAYSGMLAGVLRGDYQFADAHVDCVALAASAQARFILDEAVSLDPDRRVLSLGAGGLLGFDLVSLDVGAGPLVPARSGSPVKPIGGLLDRIGQIEETAAAGGCVAVIGGGVAAVELALALASRWQARLRIVLVGAHPDIMPAAPGRARHAALEALAMAGITVRTGQPALGLKDLSAGQVGLLLADKSSIPVETALWANGVVAPEWLAGSTLATDAGGFVAVAPTLRSISHPDVFAAGDCATVIGADRPKAGVWAVRAGPVLASNLRRAALGKVLRSWRPQRRALAILGLGAGRAVAWRGSLTLGPGRLAWWWKDWLDRRWIRRYR